MSVDAVRLRIDELDAELVKILDARANAGREIGRLKHAAGLPLSQPGREEAVLARVAGLSDGSMPPEALARIFRTVMAETLGLQRAEDGGKIDAAGVIVENGPVAEGHYRMRIRAEELAGVFRPGQFFQLRIGREGEGFFLRRPFAPSEYLPDGFAFVYALVGEGTRRLSGLPPGYEVKVLAPLGRGYTLLQRGERAVVMGGGCGAPSVLPLVRRLRGEGVETLVYLGARSAGMLLEEGGFKECAHELSVATDDGSRGVRGNPVALFREDCGGASGILTEGVKRIYACGPLAMLRAAAEAADEMGIPCEVSLEERMACGFGACMGCVVPMAADGENAAARYRRVCHDGPVFEAKELDWRAIR